MSTLAIFSWAPLLLLLCLPEDGSKVDHSNGGAEPLEEEEEEEEDGGD